MPAPAHQNSTAINFVLMARFHAHVMAADLREALDRLKGRHPVFDLRGPRDILNPCAPTTGPYPLALLSGCTPEDWGSILH